MSMMLRLQTLVARYSDMTQQQHNAVFSSTIPEVKAFHKNKQNHSRLSQFDQIYLIKAKMKIQWGFIEVIILSF